MDQYFDIISASDAWLIADDDGEEERSSRTADHELRPTNSARRIKALVEQVTGTYMLVIWHIMSHQFLPRPLFSPAGVLSSHPFPNCCPAPFAGTIPWADIFFTRRI